MKKRLLSAVLAIALLLSFVPAHAAGSASLSVSSATLAEGETTAKLSVSLDANSGDLALLSFTLDYDKTALTLSKFSAGDVWDETDGSATAKKTTGKFNWYCGEQGYDITGVVATMEFTVNEGAAPGDYTINLTGITASDYDEVKMETSVVAGTIKVPAPAGPTYTTTALKYADGALTLEAAEAITGKVVVVSYTDSGKRLVQAQFIDVNVAADSATPITFNVAAGTSYKAMLWLDNVNCKPLIDAIGW